MKLIAKLLFFVSFSCFLAACGRESTIDITDTIPDIEPDTTIVSSTGSLLMSNYNLELDTAIGTNDVYFIDSSIQNNGYNLVTFDEGYNPFLLFWQPITSNENGVLETTYQGQLGIAFTDASLYVFGEWYENGENPDTAPTSNELIVESYDASGVSITVSDKVTVDTQYDPTANVIITTETMKVTIEGQMVAFVSGFTLPVSGSFICTMQRTEYL